MWQIDGEPKLIDSPDPATWLWPLRGDRSAERRKIAVSISGTAMTASTVPELVEAARHTEGRSAVERVLAWVDWIVPPVEIRLRSETELPDVITADGDLLRAVPC